MAALTRNYPAPSGVAFWGPPLDPVTGGNLYDRALLAYLRSRGHTVTVRSFGPGESPTPADAAGAAAVLQDELLHDCFRAANERLGARPGAPGIIAVVHHLKSDEPEHGVLDRRRIRKREAAYLRTVDAVLSPSRATADAALRIARSGIPAAVAPPGRDLLGGEPLPADLPTAEEIRQRARRPLQAAFVGNLIPRKRLLELLEAVAAVPDWRLAVAGRADPDPDYAARCQERAAAPDLAGRVRFRGPLGAKDLAALLRSSQLLAVPSTHEGFGIVYLEGFAFGLPALAAGRGGAPELVAEGDTGFLMPPDSREALHLLARRLAALGADRRRLGAMGVAASRRHRAHPTWSQSLEAVSSLLPAAGPDGTPA